MSKGDKLVRSLRQLFEINRARLRDRVGMCAVSRHFQCFILTKNWIDGTEVVKEPEVEKTPEPDEPDRE
jgi:hypothetical protein